MPSLKPVSKAFLIILFSSVISYGENSFDFTSDRVMQAIPLDSGAFFEAHLINTGDQRDTYTIIKLENIPHGWFSVFCVDSLCYLDSAQVSLDPGDTSLVEPDIFPQLLPGDGEITMRVTSENSPADPVEIVFRAVSGYQTLLINHGVVEDQYRFYYEDALSSSGIGYNYWDRNFSSYLYEDLLNFDKLIVYSGDLFEDIFTGADTEALQTFLASGGDMLVTGQGLASSLEGSDFLEETLGVRYLDTYQDSLAVDGIDGDPIGDGLHFLIFGDGGAGNQVEPDIVEPLGDSAPVFVYLLGQISGSRLERDGYKVVFLAFGLEAVDGEDTRAEIISRSLVWFEETTAVGCPDLCDSDSVPESFFSLRNYPNPFNSETMIVVSYSTQGTDSDDVSIEIFDLSGKKVAEIPVGGSGETVLWDGRNSSGLPVASGVYFYRLNSPRFESRTSRMVLVK
ncbi:MAG: T9SS type A sorting domain-containing protein [Candidatus Zixiibacteriota bacterium]